MKLPRCIDVLPPLYVREWSTEPSKRSLTENRAIRTILTIETANEALNQSRSARDARSVPTYPVYRYRTQYLSEVRAMVHRISTRRGLTITKECLIKVG